MPRIVDWYMEGKTEIAPLITQSDGAGGNQHRVGSHAHRKPLLPMREGDVCEVRKIIDETA